jgi:hypothetical protein
MVTGGLNTPLKSTESRLTPVVLFSVWFEVRQALPARPRTTQTPKVALQSISAENPNIMERTLTLWVDINRSAAVTPQALSYA